MATKKAVQIQAEVNGEKKEIQAEASAISQEAAATPTSPNALETLATLEDRFRVPAWQQAALCRFMGWNDGKMLTEAEYKDALNKLAARRLGGGRVA